MNEQPTTTNREIILPPPGKLPSPEELQEIKDGLKQHAPELFGLCFCMLKIIVYGILGNMGKVHEAMLRGEELLKKLDETP